MISKTYQVKKLANHIYTYVYAYSDPIYIENKICIGIYKCIEKQEYIKTVNSQKINKL